jgi:cell division protein FtsQ
MDSKSAKKERVIRGYKKKLSLFIRLFFLAAFLFVSFILYQHKKYEIQDKISNFTSKIGFKLNTIVIKGTVHIDKKDIIKKLFTNNDEYIVGMPIYGFSLYEIRDKIKEIPWVLEVSLRRVLPSTLIIEIKENSPFAVWVNSDKKILLDNQGLVLGDADNNNINQYNNLPLIFGDRANESIASLMHDLKQEPELFNLITAFEFVSERRWNLYLKDMILIKLPQERVAEAWHKLYKLQKRDGILEKDLKYIDLRLQDRIFIGNK